MLNNFNNSFKTVSACRCDIHKKWVVVDATNCFLGRLASQVANILIGKDKIYFTPFLDCGDNVIIINAGKILLSGKKLNKKKYIRYSGYPGGQYFKYAKNLIHNNPEEIIFHAVKGMLPKNKLGSKLLKNLRIFKDDKHCMDCNNPEVFKLEY